MLRGWLSITFSFIFHILDALTFKIHVEALKVRLIWCKILWFICITVASLLPSNLSRFCQKSCCIPRLTASCLKKELSVKFNLNTICSNWWSCCSCKNGKPAAFASSIHLLFGAIHWITEWYQKSLKAFKVTFLLGKIVSPINQNTSGIGIGKSFWFTLICTLLDV